MVGVEPGGAIRPTCVWLRDAEPTVRTGDSASCVARMIAVRADSSHAWLALFTQLDAGLPWRVQTHRLSARTNLRENLGDICRHREFASLLAIMYKRIVCRKQLWKQ